MRNDNNQTQSITHLSTLVDRYSVFVFPVLGTLHNGERLSEKAFTCLLNLSKLGKNVAIFSNIPKRRHVLIQDLANIGIPPSLYQHVITSGEDVFHALKERKDVFHSALGKKCYVIGSSESLTLLEGLNLNRVTFIDEADFVLALGPDEWHSDLDYYKPLLQKAADLTLPMVCASPDLNVKYDGERSIRAGAMAAYYETLGGKVAYHGKPHRAFYNSLLKDLEPFTKGDILIIGDSLLTDIKGAMDMEIHSILCMTDTTAIELKLSRDREGDFCEAVQEKIQSLSIEPTYIMETLLW